MPLTREELEARLQQFNAALLSDFDDTATADTQAGASTDVATPADTSQPGPVPAVDPATAPTDTSPGVAPTTQTPEAGAQVAGASSADGDLLQPDGNVALFRYATTDENGDRVVKAGYIKVAGDGTLRFDEAQPEGGQQ